MSQIDPKRALHATALLPESLYERGRTRWSIALFRAWRFIEGFLGSLPENELMDLALAVLGSSPETMRQGRLKAGIWRLHHCISTSAEGARHPREA
jgi:hypothetical protein